MQLINYLSSIDSDTYYIFIDNYVKIFGDPDVGPNSGGAGGGNTTINLPRHHHHGIHGIHGRYTREYNEDNVQQPSPSPEKEFGKPQLDKNGLGASYDELTKLRATCMEHGDSYLRNKILPATHPFDIGNIQASPQLKALAEMATRLYSDLD